MIRRGGARSVCSPCSVAWIQTCRQTRFPRGTTRAWRRPQALRRLRPSSPRASSAPLAALFSRELLVGTLLLWIVFAVNLGEFHALQNWLPTILQSHGHALDVMVTVTTLTTIGGIIAAFIVGPAMDRLSAYGAVGVRYILGVRVPRGARLSRCRPRSPRCSSPASVWACVSGGQKACRRRSQRSSTPAGEPRGRTGMGAGHRSNRRNCWTLVARRDDRPDRIASSALQRHGRADAHHRTHRSRLGAHVWHGLNGHPEANAGIIEGPSR